MFNLKIINYIQYRSHLLLNLKNKILLNSLLYFGIIFIFINLYETNYSYCMINEDNSSSISSIPELDFGFIDHNTENIVFYTESKYIDAFRDKYTQEEWSRLNDQEKIIGPAFECFKENIATRTLVSEVNSFDLRTFEEKLEILKKAYIFESTERGELTRLTGDYYDQATRRHNSLLESKVTIRSLIQENLELKNHVDELERLVRENLRK